MPSIVTPIWPWRSGSRHFQPTSNPADVGGLKTNPSGFTRSEVVRLLYGVKQFRLHLQISATVLGVSKSVDETLFFTLGCNDITHTTPTGGFTTELQMADYSPGSVRWIPPSGFWIQVLLYLLGSPNYIFSGDGLYYPYFAGSRLCSDAALGYFTWGFHQSGASFYISANGNFCGKDLQVELGYFADTTINSISFEFIQKPDGDGYWPYDPGDGGGPIWDATTGAQLRNPFAS